MAVPAEGRAGTCRLGWRANRQPRDRRQSRYLRWLARCAVGGQDLGRWMALSGWAVSYRDCKCEMIRSAVNDAKAAWVGIWAGTFQMSWNWRKTN